MDTSNTQVRVDPSKDALIVVDMQNDFVLPSGSLAVRDAEDIIPGINRVSQSFPFRSQIYTLDWHPSSHCSFKENGGLWPVHCVQGTPGAELHKDLCTARCTHYVRKGSSPSADSYSAFQDDKNDATPLHAWLTEEGIKRVFVCGVALDYCVFFTAMDARTRGYEVCFLTDLSRAVDTAQAKARMAAMTDRGIHLIPSAALVV